MSVKGTRVITLIFIIDSEKDEEGRRLFRRLLIPDLL